MRKFVLDMQIANLSPVTIKDRCAIVERLRLFLGDTALLDATPDDLHAFQTTFAHLQPASVNIYTRHLRAFYRWAHQRGFVDVDPAARLVVPKVAKGRPHPTPAESLRVIFACTTGPLRIAYLLATFAGLRCGEICRLQRRDIDLDSGQATALIHGKGRKERTVPLLDFVVDELYEYGLPRTGWVVLRKGMPYAPKQLSLDSHLHLAGLGLQTTLHSMRHTFLTNAGRMTRDPMFVRDLAGHESVHSTEGYMLTSMQNAHARLAGMGLVAADVLETRRQLRTVGA